MTRVRSNAHEAIHGSPAVLGASRGGRRRQHVRRDLTAHPPHR